jgi:hypothetical protein
MVLWNASRFSQPSCIFKFRPVCSLILLSVLRPILWFSLDYETTRQKSGVRGNKQLIPLLPTRTLIRKK